MAHGRLENHSGPNMMPRLHIEMKSSQTTRQRRRVVWITIELLTVFVFLFGAGRLFLLRTTLLALAPLETDIAVTFVGKQALEAFFEHLGANQAVTDRSVTFNDLRPHVGRELAVFIDLEEKNQMVAFQGMLPEEMKVRLELYGISVQENAASTILSTTTVDTSRSDTSFRLASFLPNYAGKIRLGEESGTLFLQKNGILVKVNTGVDIKVSVPKLHTNTMALLPIEWTYWRQLGIDATGVVELRSDESEIGYLLQVNQKLDSQKLAKVVQKAALLQNPIVESVVLPDQGTVSELRLDDERLTVTLEEVEVGVRITAVNTHDDSITGWVDGEKAFLTNRWSAFSTSSVGEITSSCLKSANAYIFPKKMEAIGLLQTPNVYANDYFLKLFREIAISSMKVKFCW